MKADQARVRDLLTQTITLMCKNGLEFSHDLRVEGLLAVTVDGTDVFVIHMDEKVTDRPSYAAGPRYTESTTGRHQRVSASSAASDAHDTSVNHFNDGLYMPTPSAVGDKTERSSPLHTEDVQIIKKEPNVEDSDDDDDDVTVVESDVISNIPLPVIQGMNECEDNRSCYMPLSPASKKRRMFQGRMSHVPASVASISDDQLGDTHMWSDSTSCTPSSSNVCIPLTVDSDIGHHSGNYDVAPHASFLSTNGSQAWVSSWY